MFVLFCGFSQFTCEKLDLITDPRIAVDQDNILAFDPAAAALGAVAGFPQELFRTHVNISAFCPENEFLKASFLFVLVLGHRVSVTGLSTKAVLL